MEKIESLGYHIVSMTCDMHKSNQKLSRDLGVTIENPRFENPFRPGSYVYWIFDPCHLLKVAFTYDVIFFLGIFDLPTGCCQKFETDASPFYDYFQKVLIFMLYLTQNCNSDSNHFELMNCSKSQLLAFFCNFAKKNL